MKKGLKFIFLFILSVVFIFTSGFTESDWNSLKKNYDIDENTETIKCIYQYKDNENTNLGFKKYTLILSPKSLSDSLSEGIYDQFDSNAAKPLIAAKNSNTESSLLLDNGKKVLYSNYNFGTFIDYYKKNNKCSPSVYFCSSPGNDDNYIELKNLPYNSTYNYTCYQFVSNDASEEDLHPNGCYYDGSKSCKQYIKVVGEKALYVELGLNNSNRQYVVFSYNANFSPSAVSADMVGEASATLRNGDTVFIKKDDKGKTFFDYNCSKNSCNYPSDIKIVYGCSGNNYFYYLFNNNSTYDKIDFGGISPTNDSCEPLTIEPPELNTDLPDDIDTCSSLLGNPDTPGSPASYIVIAFDVIKYVALVLLIVLSVMDFTSAVAKQDKDAMAKVTKKLMIRFILCIIIFLLPWLVKLLLKYFVERQTDLCGM